MMNETNSYSTQHKLILLYFFDKMEMPMSEATIFDACSNNVNGWIAFMDCKIALGELIDCNFLYRNNNGPDAMYTITPEGRVCLGHFYSRIPSSLRENILEYIKQNRMTYRRIQEYFSDYRKKADGTYDVILKIKESMQTEPSLNITINVPSRTLAKQMYQKWRDKAPQVYALLYDNLAD